EVLSLLFDSGVDVNTPHDNDLTLLMWAAAYGRADTVRFLLARGAKPEARDNRGQTAREMAIAGGHLATAQLLQPR
ncbi:MAG TPA: ankyrin repeat domain-containing protein, partial [Burkholderiales bacterium]|nr:ankyrin repeat domain-containing protein [Burkholderiales bacterium]